MIEALSSCPVCLKQIQPIDPQPMRTSTKPSRPYKSSIWAFACIGCGTSWMVGREASEFHYSWCVRQGLYHPPHGIRERETGTPDPLLPLRDADRSRQHGGRVLSVPALAGAPRARERFGRRRAS